MKNIEEVLFSYKPPVPSPCGNEFSKVDANCAMQFKPTLDSSAEVIHHGILNSAAS